MIICIFCYSVSLLQKISLTSRKWLVCLCRKATVEKEQRLAYHYNVTASWCSGVVGKRLRFMGCIWMSCLMMFNRQANVFLDTREHFLNLLSPEFLYRSSHHDLLWTLCLVLSSLSITNQSFYIIFIHLLFITPYLIYFIYILCKYFFEIFLKILENYRPCF